MPILRRRIPILIVAPFQSRLPRYREVLTWAAAGKSAGEMGEILGVSSRTVAEHAQQALGRLGAVNRTLAVAIAIRDRLNAI
jgi:LuxR family quorum sensing-dependent transcriptional regulator